MAVSVSESPRAGSRSPSELREKARLDPDLLTIALPTDNGLSIRTGQRFQGQKTWSLSPRPLVLILPLSSLGVRLSCLGWGKGRVRAT